MNTVPRVARTLGMSEQTLRRLLKRGRIAGVVVPSKKVRHLMTNDEVAIIRRYVGLLTPNDSSIYSA